jgi:hypothetical protein
LFVTSAKSRSTWLLRQTSEAIKRQPLNGPQKAERYCPRCASTSPAGCPLVMHGRAIFFCFLVGAGLTASCFVWHFDDFTLAAVKEFQQRKSIKDDGIVGDQTWAALRGEPYIPKAGDDGRAPGTYVEQGIELRFIGQYGYMPDDDYVRFWADSVGTVHPETGTIKAFGHLKGPDGSERDVTVVHEGYDAVQYFHIDAITGGVAGRYAVIVQLPSDTGADTFQFEFDRN